jgi:hypothetical protein
MTDNHIQFRSPTRRSRLSLDPAVLRDADLLAISQFCAANPAFTQGSVRWTIFQRGDELERAGAIVRIGRRVLIRPAQYVAALTSRRAA